MTLSNHKYPFVIPLCALIGGIIGADYIFLSDSILYALCLSIAVLFCFSKCRNLGSVFLFPAIFLCGLSIGQPPSFQPIPHHAYNIRGCCKEAISPQRFILSISGQSFYLSTRDSFPFIRGDSLLFSGHIRSIDHAEETSSFNHYLLQQGIHYKIFSYGDIQKNGHKDDLYSFFQRIRNRLINKNRLLIDDPNHCGIINALCLGYKNDLDLSTRNLFADTGCIHLLAVSGLHTGIVYLFITYIFKLLHIRNKKIYLLTIPLLWGYACITGLSPSIVRAAEILSFITIGNAFNRDYTPLNSIAASAFLTLLFQPSALYSVSMQLSYAAYTGIVIFYPFFNQFTPHFPPFFAKLYSLFCVTLSAQLTTFPLCNYYFHIFNPEGLLINLVAVPIASILLYVAIILLLLPVSIGIYISVFIRIVCHLLLYLLDLANKMIPPITDLYPDIIYTLLGYVCLFCCGRFLLSRNRYALRLTILSISLLFSYSCYHNWALSHKNEIVIFHLTGKTCILLNHHGYYCFLNNNMDSIALKSTRTYIQKNKLIPLSRHSRFISESLNFQHNTLIYQNDTLSILSPAYKLPDVSHKIIVTANIRPTTTSPQSTRAVQQVILDGSCNYFCIQAWENFCNEREIPFLKTEETGSIRISLK